MTLDLTVSHHLKYQEKIANLKSEFSRDFSVLEAENSIFPEAPSPGYPATLPIPLLLEACGRGAGTEYCELKKHFVCVLCGDN